MKKKQLAALLMAAVVSQGAMLVAQEVNVATEVTATAEVKDTNNNYITKVGEITAINEVDGKYRVLIGTAIDGIEFVVDNSEMIIDAATLAYLQPSELQVGMNITVVVSKDAPMTMSLPAMISDQIAIIINSDEKRVEMSYFDETLLNEENSLKLNIDRNTYITNTTGERRIFTAEDVQNHSIVVIYTAATYSLPAQTTPDMVLVLPSNEKVEYVAVSEIAEAQGYDVAWDNKAKSVTLTKQENTIVLTVGKVECVYNGVAQELKEQIKLENGKVYVSSDLGKLLS